MNLIDQLHKLRDLLKANLTPSLRMPGATQPKPPKMPSVAPKTKKNPIKVAEQVTGKQAKPYAMQQATQQVKANTNQMALALKSEGNSHQYHIHVDGHRVTHEPVTLEHVNQKYGGVKALEATGHRLVPVHQERLHQHQNGQWSLRRG